MLFNALFKKIKEGGTITVKEGVTESIEEGLPQLITGMSLAMIDPTYDVAGNVTGSAILGKLTGAGTAGGIYTGNAVADTLMSVNSDVINAMGNAGKPHPCRCSFRGARYYRQCNTKQYTKHLI